jgi:hypothetical protein
LLLKRLYVPSFVPISERARRTISSRSNIGVSDVSMESGSPLENRKSEVSTMSAVADSNSLFPTEQK